jgi:FkbH-like protein
MVAIAGRLTDKFGDNGLVTVLIASVKNHSAHVDAWLMSCRVFKRGLEYAAFKHLLDILKARGVKRVNGTYLPTEKNALVENLYSGLGFSAVNSTEWTALIDDIILPETYMEVRA